MKLRGRSAARAEAGQSSAAGSGNLPACLAALLLATAMPICEGASLAVKVQDATGRPVPDAAVYAEPASGQQPAPMLRQVEIEQKHRTFIPLVTVIQAGTDIAFPNRDTVRHHVYSFSPAKTFEIKLYSGSGKTEHFDKTGTVVIGCNIHDQMIAYIQVVPTPYFAKTDASGDAVLAGLLPGRYTLKAWHYRLPPGTPTPQQGIEIGAGDAAASFKLELSPSAGSN